MWRALVAGMVIQHSSIEALLKELNRNSVPLDACVLHPVPLRGKRQLVRDPQSNVIHVIPTREHSPIPSSYNISRYVAALLRVDEEEGLLSQMIVDLPYRLMDLIPDFGVRLGCDGKPIASKSTGRSTRRRERHRIGTRTGTGTRQGEWVPTGTTTAVLSTRL